MKESVLKTDDISIENLVKQKYPEELLTYTKKYPETRQFVYNYKKYSEYYNKQNINIRNDVKKGVFPLFLQWDYRWGYRSFASGFFAPRGCGPTCMSMVYSGLTGHFDKNPYILGQWALKHGYYVDNLGTSYNFFIKGAQELGITAVDIGNSKEDITKYLKDHYVLICNVKKGDFTTAGHYIVLTSITSEDKLIIHDPNSITNSSKMWEIDRVIPQIKNSIAYKA